MVERGSKTLSGKAFSFGIFRNPIARAPRIGRVRDKTAAFMARQSARVSGQMTVVLEFDLFTLFTICSGALAAEES